MSEPPDVNNRRLYALPQKDGGLNIKFPSAEASIQYQNSITITKGHVNAIVKQEKKWDGLDELGNTIKMLKAEVKSKSTE